MQLEKQVRRNLLALNPRRCLLYLLHHDSNPIQAEAEPIRYDNSDRFVARFACLPLFNLSVVFQSVSMLKL
jgi:hypothetical protein